MWSESQHQGLAVRRYLEAEASFQLNSGSSEPLSTNDRSLAGRVQNHVKISTRRIGNNGDAYRSGRDTHGDGHLRARNNQASFSFGARAFSEVRDIIGFNELVG